MRITKETTIDEPWISMRPLRLGAVPTGLGTADLFITISDEERPILRLDVYGESSCPQFTRTLVCSGRLFLGYDDSVYVIDLNGIVREQISLDFYFGDFYEGPGYLLIASASELVRVSPEGKELWRSSNLGIDGVVVKNVENEMIYGEGEWDPPGGWKPFVLRLDSGVPQSLHPL